MQVLDTNSLCVVCINTFGNGILPRARAHPHLAITTLRTLASPVRTLHACNPGISLLTLIEYVTDRSAGIHPEPIRVT